MTQYDVLTGIDRSMNLQLYRTAKPLNPWPDFCDGHLDRE